MLAVKQLYNIRKQDWTKFGLKQVLNVCCECSTFSSVPIVQIYDWAVAHLLDIDIMAESPVVGLRVPPDLLKAIDRARGKQPRSAFILDLIRTGMNVDRPDHASIRALITEALEPTTRRLDEAIERLGEWSAGSDYLIR